MYAVCAYTLLLYFDFMFVKSELDFRSRFNHVSQGVGHLKFDCSWALGEEGSHE